MEKLHFLQVVRLVNFRAMFRDVFWTKNVVIFTIIARMAVMNVVAIIDVSNIIFYMIFYPTHGKYHGWNTGVLIVNDTRYNYYL